MTETERITHDVIDRHIAAGRKAEVEGEERTRIGNTPTCEDCGKPESECACYFEEDEEQADDTDPENIYNLPSMRQSVEEDRQRRR